MEILFSKWRAIVEDEKISNKSSQTQRQLLENTHRGGRLHQSEPQSNGEGGMKKKDEVVGRSAKRGPRSGCGTWGPLLRDLKKRQTDCEQIRGFQPERGLT